MYDGTGIVKNSGNNVIYVAGNYRVNLPARCTYFDY